MFSKTINPLVKRLKNYGKTLPIIKLTKKLKICRETFF